MVGQFAVVAAVAQREAGLEDGCHLTGRGGVRDVRPGGACSAGAWEARHGRQRSLYEAVTEYVRAGYNQALREKKSHVGFLMILMQRLVTSSTRAIRTTLERRLEVLREPDEQLLLFPELSEEEWADLDGQEQMDTLLTTRLAAFKDERAEVKLLLDAARARRRPARMRKRKPCWTGSTACNRMNRIRI